MAKGQRVPIHVQYMAVIQSFEVNKKRARELAATLRSIIELMAVTPPVGAVPRKTGNRIFIGHGRSLQWRVLSDFISTRLCIEFDEFNRITSAGLGTNERLSEMLDECRFAFLVMTAEDEHADGSVHARENVIHEAGLFQGRLGFRKAIVLLEEGCQEFSNMAGLNQIRFPPGRIESCFENVRQVLEREGFMSLA